ncbi:MAG: hypothetical protein ACXWKJ_19860 [Telluria sp.]
MNRFLLYAIAVTLVSTIATWGSMLSSAGSGGRGSGSGWSSYNTGGGGTYGGGYGGGGHK